MQQATTRSPFNLKPLAYLEQLFLLSPFIWLMVGVFSVPGGKSILSKLIPLVAVYCLFRFKGEWRINFSNPAFKVYSIANAIIFLFVALHHLIGGEEFSFARTLLTVQIYLTVLPWRNISLRYITIIISLGGIAVGLGAIYEVNILHLERAGFLAINPIPYSAFASIVLLSCLYAFFILPINKTLTTLYTLGSIGAITAIILSGTRGAWIALIVILLMLLLPLARALTKKKLVFTLVVGSIVLSIGGYITTDMILKRYQETKAEFSDIASNTMDTSIGKRIQAWERGVAYIYKHPILGTGTDKYKEKLSQDKELGLISANAAIITQAHFHNQYIDTLVRTGAIGLFFLLFWIMIPAWILHKQKSHKLRNWVFYSTIIMLMAGLTDVPFHHTHIIYLYSMLIGTILLVNKRTDKRTILN